jgi:hypothetical protein
VKSHWGYGGESKGLKRTVPGGDFCHSHSTGAENSYNTVPTSN